MICMGEPPRLQSEGTSMPVDAAVMAVVDRCEIDESAFEGPRPLTLWRQGPRDVIIERIRTEGSEP